MPLAAFPKCYLEDLVDGSLSVDDWIARAASELDVDGLEFYWRFVPAGDTVALDRITARLEESNLVMPMMCYSPDFTRSEAGEREREIERLERAIESTARLGGSFCRVLSGQRRPGIGRDEGLRMAAECITSSIPAAERHDVVLVLENHYKDGYWDYPEFAQSMDMFMELLNAIPDSPWFGVNYDPSNALVAGDDPLALLEAVVGRVRTMHASDRYLAGDDTTGQATLVHGVVGTGLNDYDAIFSALAAAGFDGWISIEDGQDAVQGMKHLQRSAAFLRQKMKEHGLR